MDRLLYGKTGSFTRKKDPLTNLIIKKSVLKRKTTFGSMIDKNIYDKAYDSEFKGQHSPPPG